MLKPDNIYILNKLRTDLQICENVSVETKDGTVPLRHLYKVAIQKGGGAWYNLAQFYFRGKHVPLDKDFGLAMLKYLTRSDTHNSQERLLMLGKFYEDLKQYDQAI